MKFINSDTMAECDCDSSLLCTPVTTFGDDVLVLVHTMGRVGSSSIYHSIVQALPDAVVYHTYVLDPPILAKQVVASGDVESAPRHIQDGLQAVSELVSWHGRVKLVTLVREASARDISAAFADFRRGRTPEEVEALLDDQEELDSLWFSFYSARPYKWFDREIGSLWDIDVFAHPMPDNGVQRISYTRVDMLLIRVEIGDDVKARELRELLGAPQIEVVRQNIGSRNEQWRDIYKRFKDSPQRSDPRSRCIPVFESFLWPG